MSPFGNRARIRMKLRPENDRKRIWVGFFLHGSRQWQNDILLQRHVELLVFFALCSNPLWVIKLVC